MRQETSAGPPPEDERGDPESEKEPQDRKSHPFPDMVMYPVTHLVGQDHFHLLRRCALEERVIEDDALRPPKPGDIRVPLHRPSARIHLQHILDRNARPIRQAQNPCLEVGILQRRKRVKERVDDDRGQKGQKDDQATEDAGCREEPRRGSRRIKR